MFAFLGKMFGSQKAGEAIVDGVVSAADKMFYTSEEKAEDSAKARTEGLQVYMKWLESTTGSRLARRFIALIITIPWSIAQFLSMIMDGIAPFISGTEIVPKLVDGVIVQTIVLNSDKYVQAADNMAAHATENNALVGVVLLFYFGGPAAIDGVKGLVNKWANKGEQK